MKNQSARRVQDVAKDHRATNMARSTDEYGLLLMHGFNVSPSLRLCKASSQASSSSTRASTSEPVWGPYHSTYAEGIHVWHSIPGEPGPARRYHESRLLKPASTGSTMVPSKTPEEFLNLESQLRSGLIVDAGGKLVQLLSGFELSHVQATRMSPGSHIGSHKDKEIYGEIIATVNLTGTSELTVGGVACTLQAGDAYAMFGQARADKEHGLVYRASKEKEQECRFSLTFRFVPCASFLISAQKISRALPRLQAG